MPTQLKFILAITLLAGCTSLERYYTDLPPMVLAPSIVSNVNDGRGHFRKLFCDAVHRDAIISDQDCSGWLHRLNGEDVYHDADMPNTLPSEKLELLVVTGIFGECVQNLVTVFGDALDHLARYGYKSSTIPVKGRASSEANARIIRDYIVNAAIIAPSKRYLAIAYSKGTTDVLAAISDYPEIRQHISAVVSFAGVVNGTPIADKLNVPYSQTLGKLPNSKCSIADHGEVRSLTRHERLSWLAMHHLPNSIAYFSVVAMPSPNRISTILLPLYNQLSTVDPRNDSQVIYYDAIIPGSTILGYANADHWAIALPFETQKPELAATLVDKNHYPRSQLLEAAVKMVEYYLYNRLSKPAPIDF